MSESKTGVKMSDIARRNMSSAHIGLIKSESTRKKLSESLKGRIFSNDHCKKISDFAKTRIYDKNPNFRPLSKESEKFIVDNLDKSVNWIKCNLSENVSYGRVKRRVECLKK